MLPDYQTLMLPLLEVLSQQDEIHIRELVKVLADRLGLTEAERHMLLPSQKDNLFYNRVTWANVYLHKAGLIERTKRAHYTITQLGHDLLATKPEKVDLKMLRRYPSFIEFIEPVGSQMAADETMLPPKNLPVIAAQKTIVTALQPAEVAAATPEEALQSAHAEINAALAKELLERVSQNSPAFFEQLIIDLLLAMGYGGARAEAGRRLGRSGDNGIDGVIDQDALGLDRVYVQAKRYAANNKISSDMIRNFAGSLDLHKATKGLFVTTSAFTADAQTTIKSLSKHIVLIDGAQLANLLIKFGIGCRAEAVITIRKLDEDYFENDF